MSSSTVAARLRPPMTIVHGGRGLLLAAGTAVAADHSIEAAIIVAVTTITGVVLGPVVTSWLRRRSRPVDHAVEHATEQAELAMRTIDHLIEQVDDRDAEIARLREQLARRRRP